MQRYSVLAPTVLESMYDATVVALDAESKVNGFWNTILAHYFQTNNFNRSIDPERHITGGFVDLLISRRVLPNVPGGPATYEPRVLFEGKGATGDSFLDIQKQLSDYFGNNYMTSGAKLWAIGARGSNVCFWRWDVKEKGGAKLQRVVFRNGGESYEPITSTNTPTVLSVATNQQEIQRFLMHMFATQ